MLSKEQSLERSNTLQKYLRKIKDPEFQRRFHSLQGSRYWIQFESVLQQNFNVLDALIKEEISNAVEPLQKEVDHLRRVTERYRKRQVQRDIEIIKLHNQGLSQNEIARKVGMSASGVSFARKRLDLV